MTTTVGAPTQPASLVPRVPVVTAAPPASTVIPAYASPCSRSVRYSSACSCYGITGETTTVPAGVRINSSTIAEPTWTRLWNKSLTRLRFQSTTVTVTKVDYVTTTPTTPPTDPTATTTTTTTIPTPPSESMQQVRCQDSEFIY